MDEPRRPGRRAAARLPRGGGERSGALRRHRRRQPPVLRRAVPSRGRAHAAGRASCCATSPIRSPAAAATGRWRSSAAQAIDKIRRQVGNGRVVCGLSGGVDSAVAAVLLHEAIGDQLTCIFRRHRPAAGGRGRGGREPLPRPLQHPADPSRRRRAVPRQARRRHRPRREAQDHRRHLHRRLRRRGAQARQCRVPGAGNPLPRRHRVR